MTTKMLRLAAAGMGLLTLSLLPAPAQVRPVGDSQVIASVPEPGYPEGIAIRGNRVYVSGPAAFGLTETPFVFAYDLATGGLAGKYPIKISNPAIPYRGLACITFGPDGNLYVVEPYVGIIRMRLDLKNTQDLYSAFPPPPASGALPNDLTFDAAGNLYVTDSFQGLIYKIKPGGGAPDVWFQDKRLLGDPSLPFGVNGIRIDNSGTNMYLTVTARNQDLAGVVYRLPMWRGPLGRDLQEVHVFPMTPFGPEGPDGIAFGPTGNLYVALAGSSQISVLGSDGAEVVRYAGPARIPGGTPNTLPWANPANIVFNESAGTILVTNHASLVPYDPKLFAMFDVVVKEDGRQSAISRAEAIRRGEYIMPVGPTRDIQQTTFASKGGAAGDVIRR